MANNNASPQDSVDGKELSSSAAPDQTSTSVSQIILNCTTEVHQHLDRIKQQDRGQWRSYWEELREEAEVRDIYTRLDHSHRTLSEQINRGMNTDIDAVVDPATSAPFCKEEVHEKLLEGKKALDKRYWLRWQFRCLSVALVFALFSTFYFVFSLPWTFPYRWGDYLWLSILAIIVGATIEAGRKGRSPYVPRPRSVQRAIFGSPEKWKERGSNIERRDFELSLQLFSMIRDMISNEDGLVNHRISWQVAIQGGLVAACVSLKDYLHNNLYGPIIFGVVAAAGMTFSLLCYIGVKAAFEAVCVFRETFQIYKDVLLPDLEAMPSATGDRYVARRGAYIGYLYALSPGVLWLIARFFLIAQHDRYLIHEQVVHVLPPHPAIFHKAH